VADDILENLAFATVQAHPDALLAGRQVIDDYNAKKKKQEEEESEEEDDHQKIVRGLQSHAKVHCSTGKRRTSY
jgi:ribosomal protein L12E/L44/L45/RPP1/RPP2